MSRRSLLLVGGAAAAYAALAALVAGGTLTRLDQWAVVHAMRDVPHPAAKASLAGALVPLLHTDFGSPLDVVTGVVTAPASLVLSFLIAGACCAALLRRGRTREAYAWSAAWLAGNAVEGLCKSTLDRPALYRHGAHVAAFDSSFPSGHTIRALLVAAVVVAVLPAARRWIAAWAAALLVLLEANAWHTPSDIAGGVLLSVVLVAAARRVS